MEVAVARLFRGGAFCKVMQRALGKNQVGRPLLGVHLLQEFRHLLEEIQNLLDEF